jgi:hypothetical protein
MPNQHDPSIWTSAKFITNYWIAGCDLQPWLIIDVNSEPQKDLVLLFIEPDLFDITQEVFDPKGGRNARPNRRGRKGRGKRGTLDPNTLIGRAIRGVVNPYNALKASPFRWFFPLLNLYEGVTFTAAVIDGLGDVGFEHLWGIIEAGPNDCLEIPILNRTEPNGAIIGGLNPPIAGVGLNTQIINTGFESFRFECRTDQDYWVEFQGYAKTQFGSDVKGELVLGTDVNTITATSGNFDLNPDQYQFISVSGYFEKDTYCVWGWHQNSNGFVRLNDCSMIAFGLDGLPILP